MYNIWGFLLQTIAVSIVTGIILLLKKIFEDKLSPKWQYGIWSLFAIRILVPVNVSSYVVPQIALWLEILKANVEERLSSVFASLYEPITVNYVIPVITKAPQSVTDLLFAIYIVGVIFFLLKYFIAYIRLRLLLNKGCCANQVMELKLSSVCDKYHLKPCKMIAAQGISSAFICGVFRPVMVIPAETDVDEKVLLHELIHYKYHDTIKNIGWCILRSLHWCNPLMHIAVNQIENDIESLCDQRVLELLEGEERREYGHILLSMANQKYARIPGTTSISNGGNNISKRIAAIVRFKKYPQGMALVSICIILTMFWPTIIGTAATYDATDYNQHYGSIEKSMAIARMNRCSTVAGAIDMYAKGVYQMNGAYVASASSYSEHERIAAELEEYGCYQPGKYVADIDYLHDFYVYNLDQIAEREYTAVICYYAKITDEEEYDAYIFLPVSIIYDNGWCVKEVDERTIVTKQKDESWDTIIYPKKYYGKNDVGEIALSIVTKCEINHHQKQSNSYTFLTESWDYPIDMSPTPNATFSYYTINKKIIYTHLLDETPCSYIDLKVTELESEGYYPSDEIYFTTSDHYENEWRIFKSTIDWEGSISDFSGGGYSLDADIEEIPDMTSKYIAKLNIGGIDMQDIILEEVKD